MLFRKSFNAVPPSERHFVRALLLVLLCFVAMQIGFLIPVSVADMGRWAGMLTALFLGYIWQRKNTQTGKGRKHSVDALLFGLLLLYLFSALDSVAQQISLLYWAVCFLQVVLFTLMTRRLSLESWRGLFGALVALCVYASFMALRGSVANPDKFMVQGRLTGVTNANSTGLIAMIGVIISWAKYLFADLQSGGNRKHWRLFYLSGGVGCLIALVLSGSRSSLGGMLSGILVVLFFARRVSRLLLLIPLLPFLDFFIATPFVQGLLPAFSRGGGADLLTTRRDQWEQAINLFKESPWLGKGYAVHDASGMVVDGSGYHGLLASVGIVGTILFLSIAFWILVHLFSRGLMLTKNKNHLPCNRELMALGGGSFIALLVQGIGEPWMLGPGSLMHVVFWMSAGACIAGILYPQVPREHSH